jgi:hypothetical protein
LMFFWFYFQALLFVYVCFLYFRKTYNKNTFLLRWFIAFICLNGEILFGDYICTLASWWWVRAAVRNDEESKSIFSAIYYAHFSSITHLLWRLPGS